MIGFILTVIGTGIALYATALIYSGISFGTDVKPLSIVIVAAIFGAANAVIKPILNILSLPLTILTFGMFGLLVNGGLLLAMAFVSDKLGLDFTVGGFPPKFGLDAIIAAIVGGVVLSLVSTVIGFLPFVKTSR
jgi:putative membrane protein